MTAPTEFIVIRHGETAWNTEGRLQGHQDSPLTPLGLRQAEAIGQRLADERFDALYSSDLPRAARTAEVIARRTRHVIRFDPRLRERNYGVFEGLTTTEMAERFPDDYARYLARQRDFVIPGGESISQKYHRATNCFERLACELSGQRVVVVSHGGILSDLLRRALDLGMDNPVRFKLYNASLNVFFIEGSRWLLGTWGDIAHLRAISPPQSLGERLA